MPSWITPLATHVLLHKYVSTRMVKSGIIMEGLIICSARCELSFHSCDRSYDYESHLSGRFGIGLLSVWQLRSSDHSNSSECATTTPMEPPSATTTQMEPPTNGQALASTAKDHLSATTTALLQHPRLLGSLSQFSCVGLFLSALQWTTASVSFLTSGSGSQAFVIEHSVPG